MIEAIHAARTGRWMLALVASAAAGVSGTVAFAVLLVARSHLAVACAFAAVAVVALVAGRKANPGTPRSVRAFPAADQDDYSGLPASPGSMTSPFPFAIAGLGVALSAVLFPLGFMIAVGAAWAGSDVGVYFGLGVVALGPVILAASWVLR